MKLGIQEIENCKKTTKPFQQVLDCRKSHYIPFFNEIMCGTVCKGWHLEKANRHNLSSAKCIYLIKFGIEYLISKMSYCS